MGWILPFASTIVACVGTALIDPLVFPGKGSAPARDSDTVSLLQQTVEVQRSQKPANPRSSKYGSVAPGPRPQNDSCGGHASAAEEAKRQAWTDIGAAAQEWQQKHAAEAVASSLVQATEEDARLGVELATGPRSNKRNSSGKGAITRSEVVFFSIFFGVTFAGIALGQLLGSGRVDRGEEKCAHLSEGVGSGCGEFEPGARVAVTRPFVSDTEPSVLIQRGEAGVIQRVDGMGDLLIRFEGRTMLQWVFRHSFHKLAVLAPGVEPSS